MKITRISSLTGTRRTRDLPVTEEQMVKFQSFGETIQEIFPQLSASDREFIKTGITDEEWGAILKPQ